MLATHAPAHEGVALISAAVRAGADPYRVREAAIAGRMRELEQWAGRDIPAVPAGSFVLLGGCEGYPMSLAGAATPPPIVYGIGSPAAARVPGIAVHGGPGGDGASLAVAEAVASAAARSGAPLVCGAAAGSGLVAARAAIQFQTPVVFAVATGPDVPATRAAVQLAGDVVAGGGAVLSEQPFGTDVRDAKSYRRRVNARHRVVAGLSAVLVPTDGAMPSDVADSVWAMLALGRPVVVSARKSAVGDAQLPFALAHPSPPRASALRRLGCPGELAARLEKCAPVANVVVEDLDELALAVGLLWRLSPFVPLGA